MKLLLLALLLLLAALVYPAKAWIQVPINDQPMSYDQNVGNFPFLRWLTDHMAKLGYRVPTPGEPFAWADYLTALNPDTDTPQPGDICVFHDYWPHGIKEKKPKDWTPDSKDGGFVIAGHAEEGTVLVTMPIPSSDHLHVSDCNAQIPLSKVITFWRPHKKVIAPPPTNDNTSVNI